MADNTDNPKTNADDSADEKKEGKSYREILLESLKSKGGKNGANWVERLANDTQEALGRQATLKLPGNFRDLTIQESVTTWMDKIFDLFLDYAYDFNPAVTGSNLEVTWDRPVLFHSAIKQGKWGDSETKTWTFKGSLATRSWSLILRGTKEHIQGYIVPNDQVIALSGADRFFNPYLEMVAQMDRSTVKWTIDGIEMPPDRLGEVAQDLFGALIRVSRGEQTEDEKSHLHVSAHKAPPPVPHQSLTGKYKVFATSSNLSESMKLSFSPNYVPKRNDLLSLDDTAFKQQSGTSAAASKQSKGSAQTSGDKGAGAAEAPKTQAPKPAPDKQADKQGLSPVSAVEVSDSASGPAPAPSAPLFAVSAVEVSDSASGPAPAPSAPLFAVSELEVSDSASGSDLPELAPESSGNRQETKPPASDVSAEEMNVSLALDFLVKVIDRDLEQLSRQGAEAFTKRDMAFAQEVLKKSTSLSAFKEQVAALVSQWRDQL